MAISQLPATAQGQPMSRVDGLMKVTGTATYAAEFAKPEYARIFLVTSEISKGNITAVDTSAATNAPGVLVVITHENAMKLGDPPSDQKNGGIRVEMRVPFSDSKISYGGQYVAAVVAKTLEQARHAGSLIKVSYEMEKPALTAEDVPTKGTKPKKYQGKDQQPKKGNVEKAFANEELVQFRQIYTTPTETHNPMELSATVALWEGEDRLTIYETTQFVKGNQAIIADAFGLKRENVRVICPYVGGAFGCKGPTWPHTFVAVMAAKMAKMPVKLELSRPQMFSGTGHRTPTKQTLTLAASKDGKLQAMRHEADNLTAVTGEWIERSATAATGIMYDSPAIEIIQTVYPVNIAQPSFMRAPGDCPGTFALESAIDELAAVLKMDPLQFRILNMSTQEPIKEVPFSSKHLKECFDLGAEKFGWSQRSPEPRSMREGKDLVGYGVAMATYPANKWDATARAQLKVDGTAYVSCAAHDLGTGAYTAFTQISADALGLPVEKVKFELGTSEFTHGPAAGGSNTTATVGSAIVLAADQIRAKLAALATADAASPLHGMKPEDLILAAGKLTSKSDAAKAETYESILQRANLAELVEEGELKSSESNDMAFNSFGAHFCEVRIDPDLPLVRVTRVVSVMDCGRIINPKLAHSQIIGAVVMGIGMALEEETVYDPATGLPTTRNLADYHVPVNADIHQLEAYFVGEPDYAFNPMGARGLGEIGITGIAAAIANATYHATGRRVRDLPITLDKLI